MDVYLKLDLLFGKTTCFYWCLDITPSEVAKLHVKDVADKAPSEDMMAAVAPYFEAEARHGALLAPTVSVFSKRIMGLESFKDDCIPFIFPLHFD